MKSFLSLALLVCAFVALLGLSSAQVDHGHHHHHHSADSLLGTEKEYQRAFIRFMNQYDRNYTADEFFPRYAVFKSNYQLISAHNAKSNETFTMAVNQFADLTAEEFRAKVSSFIPLEKKSAHAPHGLKQHHPHHHVKAPLTSLDWRSYGAVSSVKDQVKSECASGYAFSAVGAGESNIGAACGTAKDTRVLS